MRVLEDVTRHDEIRLAVPCGERSARSRVSAPWIVSRLARSSSTPRSVAGSSRCVRPNPRRLNRSSVESSLYVIPMIFACEVSSGSLASRSTSRSRCPSGSL